MTTLIKTMNEAHRDHIIKTIIEKEQDELNKYDLDEGVYLTSVNHLKGFLDRQFPHNLIKSLGLTEIELVLYSAYEEFKQTPSIVNGHRKAGKEIYVKDELTPITLSVQRTTDYFVCSKEVIEERLTEQLRKVFVDKDKSIKKIEIDLGDEKLSITFEDHECKVFVDGDKVYWEKGDVYNEVHMLKNLYDKVMHIINIH